MKQLSYDLLCSCLFAVALSACANNSPQTSAPAANTNTAPASNANARTDAPKSPLDGIVSASVERVEMRAGEAAETSVRLSITSGYHVNANPLTDKFFIPTTVSVKPEAGVEVEKIVYSKALKKQFAFNE